MGLERNCAMWRELIGSAFTDAKFYIPASDREIGHAEREVGIEFPAELRQLLMETNGASANYSAPLVWSVDEIIAQNRHVRSSADFAKLYQPFTDLFFFGAEGNGDQFAYRVVEGRVSETTIYEWDHETDVRDVFAVDLRDYVRRIAASVERPVPRRRSFFGALLDSLRRRS
jgi:hypothetical protein